MIVFIEYQNAEYILLSGKLAQSLVVFFTLVFSFDVSLVVLD